MQHIVAKGVRNPDGLMDPESVSIDYKYNNGAMVQGNKKQKENTYMYPRETHQHGIALDE